MGNKEKDIKNIQEAKENADRLLLKVEVAFAVVSIIAFLTLFFTSLYAIVSLEIYVLPIVCVVFAFALLIGSSCICMYIEQKAGYYKCKKCGHKYLPTFNQSMWSPHILRTKYMKCPHCKQRSWNKKVIK